MKDTILWSTLPVFLDIAEKGGLSAAARASGQSAATLSRQIARLEKHLGKRLFLRSRKGYELSSDGKALLPLARRMAQQADIIDGWHKGTTAAARIRISAGPWTALRLARSLPPADDIWRPVFVTSVARLDIARREVDIGIRNARPTQSWLAGRRIGHVRYAPYAGNASTKGWIALTGDAAHLPTAKWVAAQTDAPITAEASSPQIAATLAAAGHGTVVLPTFAAELMPGLIKVGSDIDALTSEEWLISHHEARFDPALRAALDAVAAALCVSAAP